MIQDDSFSFSVHGSDRDLKHFLGPGGEEDPSYPASEHILVQGKGVKLVMNYTLNEKKKLTLSGSLKYKCF